MMCMDKGGSINLDLMISSNYVVIMIMLTCLYVYMYICMFLFEWVIKYHDYFIMIFVCMYVCHCVRGSLGIILVE